MPWVGIYDDVFMPQFSSSSTTLDLFFVFGDFFVLTDSEFHGMNIFYPWIFFAPLRFGRKIFGTTTKD